MKLIGKDHVLFEILNSEIYIINSSITRFNISTTDERGINIDVDFELSPNSAILKLKLLTVKEYSFYWNDRYNFYYIETFKLLKKENLFYLCFDPANESSLDISENDQDFILFGSFEGYLG